MPPRYKSGTLKVVGNLEEDFSYRLSKDDLPMFINVQSDWLCIGNPEKKVNAKPFLETIE